jgi:hypothetical protein
MSLLLLFSGAGDVEEDYKKSDGSLYEDRQRLKRLHREDDEILELIITFTLSE